MRIEYIEWFDHNTNIGWHRIGECACPKIAKTLGLVIEENKNCIVVSNTRVDDDYADPLTILKCCVVKRIKANSKNLESLICDFEG
jgi:hypothetical protein